MRNKSQSSASAAPVYSICSVVAAYQLRIEISAFFKKQLFWGDRAALIKKLREMLHYGLAMLLIGAVFLACSWLFLVQLAEHGW